MADQGLPLAGRSALVTGGYRGIGRACAELLAARGADVTIVVRPDRVIETDPAPIRVVEADLCDEHAVAAAVSAAGGSSGLDVCVANAGIVELGDFLSSSSASWRAIFDVNVIGVMTTFQAAARSMVRHGTRGRLVALSSVAGLWGEPDLVPYSTSKAAVNGLTRALAAALAPHAITVNAVAPGEIVTDMNDAAFRTMADLKGSSYDDVVSAATSAIPAGRRGTSMEVAELIAFLATDGASYLTGEVIRVDGGQLLGGPPSLTAAAPT